MILRYYGSVATLKNPQQYRYDIDGNMLIGNGKKYDYNEFNKVSKLSYNGNNEEFTYDESDNLVKKVTNGDVITYYGDAWFELTITKKPIGVDDEINMKHTITIEGRTVAIHERTIQGDDKQLDKTAYVHSDAQGSVSLVTDNSRAISFRNEYTPFGESIENLSGNGSFDKQQERGYTGHRMIASANVINMNARIYDPAIARFTSPDTVVPDATMSMAHNRYIYVYNNPIKYVDPDGHFVWWIFALGAAIFTIGATSDDSFIHSVGTVVGSLMMFYGAALANTSAVGLDAFVEGAKNLSMGQMIVGGSSAGGASSFIASGGDIGETFRGAFLGGVGAAVSYGIGHGFGKNWTTATKALAHGVSQGIISELRGGEFKSGFIGGFLGKMTGGLAETMFDDKVAQYIAVTMIGGAVSEAAGGDFLDGAISAAMVHLFNEGGVDHSQQNDNLTKFSDGVAGFGDSVSFGSSYYMRRALGWDYVDYDSTAYSVGEWSSFSLGLARLGYAGLAKSFSMLPKVTAQEAVEFRNLLKKVFRLNPWSTYRVKSYNDILIRYNGSEVAVKAASGRTNSYINSLGFIGAAGSVNNMTMEHR